MSFHQENARGGEKTKCFPLSAIRVWNGIAHSRIPCSRDPVNNAASILVPMIHTPPIEGMTVGPTRPSRLPSLILFGIYLALLIAGMGMGSAHTVLKRSLLGAAIVTLLFSQYRTWGRSGAVVIRLYFAAVLVAAGLTIYWASR